MIKIQKICYVSNYLSSYHSHAGGAEQAILSTANLAKEKGASTSFFTLPININKESRNNIDMKTILSLEFFFNWIGKYIEVLKWYIFQFDPICYFLSKKYFSQKKPDIVHFGNFQFLTFSIILAARQLGIPVFVSIYDYWYFCPLTTLTDYNNKICRRFHGAWCVSCLPSKFRIIQRISLIFRKNFFNFFLKKVHKFIVLSESSRQILLDYGIEKNRISMIRLPFPDDFEQIELETESKDDSILFAGWLQKRKGLHLLLDAMLNVWEKIPDVKLYIITQKVKWEQQYEDLINSKLEKIPKDKYIFLLGQKRREELRNLIKNVTVVVVPEQWENMSPLIVIEAMLMAKPIVASNIGGIPEFIEDGKEGLLAEYSNSADFAEKILTMLNYKQIRETFGKNARQKIIKMLNKKIIADQYIRTYEESCIA